jgi:phthiodiolone/phenolphthiodiolone dimycocerosates ketoreductase
MSIELAGFLRTTLPLDLSQLADFDGGRYGSIWMPDHLVSFWPDAIWTPEFTDLAERSHSPHRYVDSLTLAAAVAASTERVRIATSVIDTVRRHPVMIAQAAVTLSHLSRGRFILGLGSGEKTNIVPYGFDFSNAIIRFEEALRVIRMLWNADRPLDFKGAFFELEDARLDAELFGGQPPPIWIGASGPRMLALTGRYADGWWPTGSDGPEEYAAKLAVIARAAEDNDRDPSSIVPAKMVMCLLGEPDEVRDMLRRPMIKSLALQFTAESYRRRGFTHPMGDEWRGIHDLGPNSPSRERLTRFFAEVDVDAVLASVPHGTPKEVAQEIASLREVGARVVSILDYSGMAGQEFAARSAAKVRETEDEVLRLAGGSSD